MPPLRTVEEAIHHLRRDPRNAQLLRDTYYDPDPLTAARAYAASAEFAALGPLVGELRGRRVLDVGAGNGIASHAFAAAGARVVALEPDPSPVVGFGAIRVACAGLPVEVVGSYGERLPFADGAFDLVFARQVLHHALDLDAMLRECARVLRPGGRFVACREHVADDEAQLRAFLAAHPIHQLVGCEGAHPLPRYLAAVRGAGLVERAVLGPYDSMVNAFPEVRTEAELRALPARWVRRKYGLLGPLLGLFPAVVERVRRRRSGAPGRLYTIAAEKPGAR